MHMDRLAHAAHSTMLEYYRRCREAEQYRAEEQQAALVLQACWRGCLQRQEIEKLKHIAIIIQKHWRGHLGRRRFAAALAAHNTELRQAYFHHQATVIQRCWRGYYSRSHVHDFYKRKAFLQSVAAANAAVKADMEAELQAALSIQQQEAQAAAKQNFETQVHKLHYLSSTASIPGIFSPPATAAAPGQLQATYTVAGQPLEHHLRAAVKQKAAVAVKQQQVLLKRALGNTQQGSGIFPAGMPVPSHSSPALSQHTTLASTSSSQGAASSSCQPAAHTSSQTSSRPAPAHTHAQTGATTKSSSSSRGSTRSSQKLQPLDQKLAHRIVETCVDQVFAAKAEPNMADGSFNPVLSLQQATDYEAAREAADLDRRLKRGLMLVLHSGQPFIPITGKHVVFSQEVGESAAANDQQCSQREASSRQSQKSSVGSEGGSCSSPDSSDKQHWRHNQYAGRMFSKHLKQVY